MEAYLLDWLQLVVRWIHVIVGIAWIGSSFYFNWLNHALRPPQTPDEQIGGELMAVHGGAFYKVTKFKVGPSALPKTLHWFKWEAYSTWLSGFILLCLVYYLGAKTNLIDPSVAQISPLTAVGIGLGVLVVGWIVYDLICKSPLVERPVLFSCVGFLLVTGAAYGLSHVFGGRGAYIHLGAMLGTIMAANVFFVIIPSQRAMVEAYTRGDPPDPTQGKKGALRSLHNNYITLPVIFIMVSNHYPTTFGHQHHWAILMGLALISAGVRHYFNLKGRGQKNVWILPVATVAIIALAFVSQPKGVELDDSLGEIKFAQVQRVILERCVPCHSATPTSDIYKVAPKNIIFDTPAQILTHIQTIDKVAVKTQFMPPGNLTGITDEERSILGAWIAAGGKVDSTPMTPAKP